MVSRFLRNRWWFAASVCAVIAVGILCSKKPNEPDPNPQTTAPSIAITNPSKDTTVAAADSQITIEGSITNPDDVGIDSLLLNGQNILGSLLDSDTRFSTQAVLAKGANKLIVRMRDAERRWSGDTVTVTRPDSAGGTTDTTGDTTAAPKTGLAKVSGTLTKEGMTRKKTASLAKNAAGQEVLISNEAIPASGADILVYDADTTSTASIAHTKTDSSGLWEVDSLKPGNYFIFAVYFDFESRSLKTAAIQNVEAVADSQVSTGEAIVVEDETSPTVVSMLDATNGDSAGLYLASKVAAGKPILSVAFTEPMDRPSAGDSVKNVVLGRIDTAAATFSLRDTVPVEKVWNGNGTELRIIPKRDLAANAVYGIMVSTSIKDLAFNALRARSMVTFRTVPRDSLPLFVVSGTTPANGDTVMPSVPLGIGFSRAADLVSASRRIVFTPAIKGFFEPRGTQMAFKPDSFLKPGIYTITVPTGIRSVMGDTLGQSKTISFVVKEITGLGEGDTATLSMTILRMMNAYQAGDLTTFAEVFHPDMRLISYEQRPEGEFLQFRTKEEFIRQMQKDAAMSAIARTEGLICAVWYWADATKSMLHKVVAKDGSGSFLFVDATGGGPLGQPRFFDQSKIEIVSGQLQFPVPGKPVVRFGGKDYVFAPDFGSLGPVTEERIEADPIFLGKLLQETSGIETGKANLRISEQMKIESTEIRGDTGFVVMSMRQTRVWSGATRPWPYVQGINLSQIPGWFGEPDSMSGTNVIKMKCVRRSGVWLVYLLSETNSKGIIQLDPAALAYTAETFTLPPSVQLISPVGRAENVKNTAGGLSLKWSRPVNDSMVKAYLIGLAEDPAFAPCRPPKGVLIFAPRACTTLTFTANGQIDTAGGVKAMVINRRPGEIGAHMLPWYDFPLDKVEDFMVLQWKVLAIADSTAPQLLAGGLKMENILAQSDFSGVKGVFAVKTFMSPDSIQTLCKSQTAPPPPNTGFEDPDRDGVPTGEELRWGTDPNNPGTYPRFDIDSDGDKFADFLEKRFGSNPQDPQSLPPTDSLIKIAYKDSDKDGFPDDVESRLGTNMFDPNNNPGTRTAFEPPVGSFTGKLFFGTNSMPITVMIKKKENAGDIDYTVIYKINSPAVEDTVDTVNAMFDKYVGELIFIVELDREGRDAGKGLKVRGRYDGMMGKLGGAVDIVRVAEGINASGPKVGEWGASNRGEDITSGGFTGSGMTGTATPAGLPMAPPNADSAYLIVSQGTAGVVAKLVYAARTYDTITATKIFKSGSSTDLGFVEAVFRKVGSILRLNGNLMMAKPDTIGYFGGIMMEDTLFRPLPYGGGFGFLKADGQPRSWQGTYRGWIFVDTTMGMGTSGPGFGGPPEYTGGIMALLDQLKTQFNINYGDSFSVCRPPEVGGIIWRTKVDTASNLLSVGKVPGFSFLNPGCVFVVVTKGSEVDTFLLFGKTDRNQVEVVAKPTGEQFVIAEFPPGQSGGTGPAPMPGGVVFVPYAGDSITASAALTAAGNFVMVFTPGNPLKEKVGVRTMELANEGDSGKVLWTVPNYANPSLLYVLLASKDMPRQVFLENGPPVVVRTQDLPKLMGGSTPPPTNQTVIYKGDSLTIVQALAASANLVMLNEPNLAPRPVGVDPSSLKKQCDQANPAMCTWIISDRTDPVRRYLFRGDPMDPSRLAKAPDGKPEVMPAASGGTGPTQNAPVPYGGDSITIAQALTASGNGVMANVPNQQPFPVVVNPATIQKICDPMNPSMCKWTVAELTQPTKRWTFMADAANPRMLLKSPDSKPVVFPADQGGTPPGDTAIPPPTGPVFYMGDSASIALALSASGNQVMVEVPNQPLVQVTVDPATLQRMCDPMDPAKCTWSITEQGQLTKRLAFLGSPTDPKMLMKSPEGRPITAPLGAPKPI